jgi:hypothetical protein
MLWKPTWDYADGIALMPAYHDMQCDHCGQIETDMPLRVEGTLHSCMKGRMEILWRSSAQRDAAVHPRERAAVWVHPTTGEVRYPPRNNVPIPARYRQQGFERREISSLRELERFSETHHVRSEAAWYDRGTGRGFDDKDR